MKRLLSLAPLLLLACAPADPPPAHIVISDAWARATAPGQSAAVYATIANPGGGRDLLRSVATPRAMMAMLHSADLSGGVARMRASDGLGLPADGTLTLAPGGTHVMLDGLRTPLKAGDTFPLTFTFASAGERVVTVTVVAPGDR